MPTCTTSPSVTYLPVPNGDTDYTAAINAAETALNAAGGGTLIFSAGTYMTTGVTKLSNTKWKGQGAGVTSIKLIAGTTVDAVVAGQNAYTLFGSGSMSGICDWAIEDLTVDGNYTASGTASDGIGVYGFAWKMRGVETQYCTGYGVRTEYPIADDNSLPVHNDNASAWFENNLIHDANLGGVLWAGPQDSSLIGDYIYRNLNFDLKTSLPGGAGLKITNTHGWGSLIDDRQSVTGLWLTTDGNLVSNSTFEGAAQQVWITGSANVITGGRYYYQSATPNTAVGFHIGDSTDTPNITAAQNTIITTVNNCETATVDFDKDGGGNTIIINGQNSGATSAGWIGEPAGNSFINLNVTNATTNAKLVATP